MRTLEDLTQKELVDLLNKCWMTHDSMWFFHSLQQLGIETTNTLNKSAIQTLSAIEIKRIKSALGFKEDIDGFDAFKQFFLAASCLVIPDFMNVRWDFPEMNQMTWEFNEALCFAYKGVKRLGALDGYECGVLYRVKCWLDELGIKHTFTPEIGGCHMHTSGCCAGTIQLAF